MVNSIKMSRNRLVKMIVPYVTKDRFTDVKFGTFTGSNAVNDVGGSACKVVPNNKIGFRFGSGSGRVEERTRVTTSTRARKRARCCRYILSTGVAQ